VREEAERILVEEVDLKNKTFLEKIDEQNRDQFEEFNLKWDQII